MMTLNAKKSKTSVTMEPSNVETPHSSPRKSAVKRWSGLLACLMVLWGFMFVFAPWLQSQSKAVQTLSTYITENDIDAGAVYYTEVAEVGEADLMIRDTFRFYLPQQRQK